MRVPVSAEVGVPDQTNIKNATEKEKQQKTPSFNQLEGPHSQLCLQIVHAPKHTFYFKPSMYMFSETKRILWDLYDSKNMDNGLSRI